MSSSSARAAAVAAVGAIIAAALPAGMASAVSPPVDAVVPSTLVAGDATATPFDVKVLGQKGKKVTFDFALSATSGSAMNRLAYDDVVLQYLDPTTGTWKNGRTAKSGADTAVTFDEVFTPANIDAVAKFRLAIKDEFVNGDVTLKTTATDTATSTAIASDSDTIAVVGQRDVEVSVTPPTTPVAADAAAGFPFTSSIRSTGQGIKNVAVRVTAQLPSAPAGTVSLLPSSPVGVALVAGSDKLVGSTYTATYTIATPTGDIDDDSTTTQTWSLTTTDPKLAGTVGLEVALVDKDIPGPALFSGSANGTLTASDKASTVTVGDFNKAAKADDPTTGVPEEATAHVEVAKTAGANYGTPKVKLTFSGANLTASDIEVNLGVNIANNPLVLQQEAPGKVSTTVDATDLTGAFEDDVTVTVINAAPDGDVAFTAALVDGTRVYASATKTLKIVSTSTVAAPTNVRVTRGSADTEAILSWDGIEGRTITATAYHADGAPFTPVVRTANSVLLKGIAAGEQITAEVRVTKIGANPGVAVQGRYAGATYTAAAAPVLVKPSDLKVTVNPSTLEATLGWKGSADNYKVIVTDQATQDRGLSDPTVPDEEFLLDSLTSGHVYSIAVMAADATTSTDAATISVAPKAPVDPAPVASVKDGNQVVTWTATDLSLTTVTLNGKPVEASGSSFTVDAAALQAGANTVKVTVESYFGTTAKTNSVVINNDGAVTIANKVEAGKATFTGTVSAAAKADREVQLQAKGANGWANVGGAVKTDANGAYSVAATPTATTTYRVALLAAAGSTGAVSAESTVTVESKTVKAALKASSTKIRKGQVISLTNTVPGAATGTRVQLQQFDGKAWVTILTSKVSSTDTSVFRVKPGKGTKRFRAVVSAAAGINKATSNTVIVTVR